MGSMGRQETGLMREWRLASRLWGSGSVRDGGKGLVASTGCFVNRHTQTGADFLS